MLITLGAHAQRGLVSTLNLTSRVFVRLTKDTTYLTGNEGQNICAVFSENAPLQSYGVKKPICKAYPYCVVRIEQQLVFGEAMASLQTALSRRCCRCNRSAKCVRCACVRNRQPCGSCLPRDHGRCQNRLHTFTGEEKRAWYPLHVIMAHTRS